MQYTVLTEGDIVRVLIPSRAGGGTDNGESYPGPEPTSLSGDVVMEDAVRPPLVYELLVSVTGCMEQLCPRQPPDPLALHLPLLHTVL